MAANHENQLNAGPLVFFSNIDTNPDQFDHVNVSSEETNLFQFGGKTWLTVATKAIKAIPTLLSIFASTLKAYPTAPMTSQNRHCHR